MTIDVDRRRAEDQARGRPGGRSARVQAAVHRAVTDLVSERGPDQVTIPLVAARAGVNPTSIYRRWGDVQRLLADVALTHLIVDCPIPNSGNLRLDLVRWAAHVEQDISRPKSLAFLRTVLGEGGTLDGRGKCLLERRKQIDVILAQAADRGEAVPSNAAVVDHVLAPVYFRVLFGIQSGRPNATTSHEALVDRLLGS